MTSRKKVPYFTKLDPELRSAMRRFKEDVGVPEAQQIDRALRQWLGDRDIKVERAHGRIRPARSGDVVPRKTKTRRGPK